MVHIWWGEKTGLALRAVPRRDIRVISLVNLVLASPSGMSLGAVPRREISGISLGGKLVEFPSGHPSEPSLGCVPRSRPSEGYQSNFPRALPWLVPLARPSEHPSGHPWGLLQYNLSKLGHDLVKKSYVMGYPACRLCIGTNLENGKNTFSYLISRVPILIEG